MKVDRIVPDAVDTIPFKQLRNKGNGVRIAIVAVVTGRIESGGGIVQDDRFPVFVSRKPVRVKVIAFFVNPPEIHPGYDFDARLVAALYDFCQQVPRSEVGVDVGHRESVLKVVHDTPAIDDQDVGMDFLHVCDQTVDTVLGSVGLSEHRLQDAERLLVPVFAFLRRDRGGIQVCILSTRLTGSQEAKE
jgi:hypothetical protein